MGSNKVMIKYASDDGEFSAIATISKDKKRLIVHEPDKERINMIRKWTNGSDAFVFEDDEKINLSIPPRDKTVEKMLSSINEESNTNQTVFTLGSKSMIDSINWNQIIKYLFIFSPIYIPIFIFIFGSTVFDSIIFFLYPRKH